MPNYNQYPGMVLLNQQRLGSQSCYPVLTHDNKIYIFLISIFNNDLYYVRSDDGGLTWQVPTLIFTGTVDAVSVWYDRWTPGNTGDLIHIAYIENGTDDCLYRNLNTSTNTLGTQTVVALYASAVTGANQNLSITRAIGGNLYCANDIDGGTENNFSRSVDVGANWTQRTDLHEAASADYILLAPGFGADNQDIIALFWDRSADEISRKFYDDSANTWAETSIATSMVDIATFLPNFALTVDDANDTVLMVAWTGVDTASANLNLYSVPTASSPTLLSNVVNGGTDDQGMCGISLDPVTGYIYVYYGGKSNGAETFQTAINIYYKVSTDAGVTWGAETQLTFGVESVDWLQGCPLLYWGSYPLALIDVNAGFAKLLFRRGQPIVAFTGLGM